jgi:hypothetical protein
MMGTALAKYDAARHALQAASKIDEVKLVHDKAVAMALYAQQAKDTQLIGWATEIKLRAERRAGAMLAKMPKQAGAKGVGKKEVASSKNEATLLKDIGISWDQSSQWQQIAAMPDETFEAALTTADPEKKPLTTKALLATVKGPAPKKEPIELADDVRDTLAALVKRWPTKRAVVLDNIRITLGNLMKGAAQS